MWTISHLERGVSDPPGCGPGKGGWGTVRVAGVHAARMIDRCIQYLISTADHTQGADPGFWERGCVGADDRLKAHRR